MNSVCLIGRMTSDPEIKYTQSGKAVVSFQLAVNADAEHVDFLPCVAWEKRAETIAQYVKKGDQLGISGIMKSRQYTDKDGKKRTAYDVLVSRIDFCAKAYRGGSQDAPESAQEGFWDITDEEDGDFPF